MKRQRRDESLGLFEFWFVEEEAVELLERWQREFSRPSILIVLPPRPDRQKITHLIEEVNRDFDRNILALRKKKRQAERMLKRLRFESGGKPGRPKSTLAWDIVTEQLKFSSQNPGSRMLSYRQIAKRLALKHKVNWRDPKTNENGNTPRDLFIMRVKNALKR